MKTIHLTDEMLQAYLLKETEDDTIALHFSSCSLCRKRLEEYQLLVDSVQTMKPETFSFNVSALAMNRIVLYEKKKTKKQAWMYWGLLALLFIAIASFSIPFLPKILSLFYSTSLVKTLLVTGTGLAVSLFLLADMWQQYKMKENKLFKKNLQPTP